MILPWICKEQATNILLSDWFLCSFQFGQSKYISYFICKYSHFFLFSSVPCPKKWLQCLGWKHLDGISYRKCNLIICKITDIYPLVESFQTMLYSFKSCYKNNTQFKAEVSSAKWEQLWFKRILQSLGLKTSSCCWIWALGLLWSQGTNCRITAQD